MLLYSNKYNILRYTIFLPINVLPLLFCKKKKKYLAPPKSVNQVYQRKALVIKMINIGRPIVGGVGQASTFHFQA